ncbi:hypothetical protein ACQ69O_005086 [Escherichia coli]|uniref:hypothetical protein n=1 Tax=Solibacillus sp. FSL K6-1126 TaxID=2921463 RepID=UPI0030FB8CAF
MKKKEQEQLNTLFQARKEYNNWQTQEELQKQALQRMDDRLLFLKNALKKE